MSLTPWILASILAMLALSTFAILHADDAYTLSQLCAYDQANRQPPRTIPFNCTLAYVTANGCSTFPRWITCDGSTPQRIISLTLTGDIHMQKTTLDSIGRNMTALQTLLIMYINGGLDPVSPLQNSPWPASLANLVNLTSLTMDQASLSGAWPAAYFSAWSKLATLSLSLTATLPDDIGRMTALQKLALTLSVPSTIPSSLGGNLTKLTSLYIANLYGPMPPNLGNINGLTELGLIGDRLCGCWPFSLAQTPKTCISPSDYTYMCCYPNSTTLYTGCNSVRTGKCLNCTTGGCNTACPNALSGFNLPGTSTTPSRTAATADASTHVFLFSLVLVAASACLFF